MRQFVLQLEQYLCAIEDTQRILFLVSVHITVSACMNSDGRVGTSFEMIILSGSVLVNTDGSVINPVQVPGEETIAVSLICTTCLETEKTLPLDRVLLSL
ncbi:hypothetical protein BaRGS_00023216 [Batillaria attramentaria]|uniref:Uncharacterized protein n=1 Tax=Batillaria attramentaria TaxID=370345 RepID=A0ABD0KEB7_9CAEN